MCTPCCAVGSGPARPGDTITSAEPLPAASAAAPTIAAARRPAESTIFISYRRDDSAPTTGRIYDRLIASFGKDAVFKDVDNIPYGEHFPHYIASVIAKCSVMLAIIGPRWLDAAKPDGTRRLDDPQDWVRIEIETALSLGVTVIPLLVDGAHMPKTANLPESLQGLAPLNSLAVRNDPDFNGDIYRLRKTLERWVPWRPGPLRRHLFAIGSVGSLGVVVGLLAFLNLNGYRDDLQYAAAFLDGAVLAALAGVAIVCLGLAWLVGRAHVIIGRALSVTILLAALALPFASPQLTSDCGTLICPPAAPADQQVLHLGFATGTPAFKLDPGLDDDTGEWMVAQVLFPALVRLDAHLQVIPWAASRYSVSADGRTYTFALHPGLQWSDGTPIQANDFAFALNRSLDPCTANDTAYLLLPIQDAQRYNIQPCTNGKPDGAIQTLIGDSLLVPDPQTLAIKLEQPATYVLDALTNPVAYAVPRSLLQAYGARWTDHLTDGAGWGGDLFKLTTVDHALAGQTHLALTRNEQFWGTKPKLREIDFTFYSDDAEAYKDYVAGTLDVSQVSPDDLASAKLRGTELRSIGTLSTVNFNLNWATPPFDDVRMRQAFALALDKNKLVTDFRGDLAIPTNHIVPEGMPGYNPNLTGPKNSGLQGNAQVAQALAQAYANEKCGGSLSACPPVTLGVPAGIPNGDTLATEAQQMWQQALPRYPITVQKVANGSTEFKMVNAKQLQAYFFGWAADYPDPRDFLSLLYMPGSEYNLGQVSQPDATSLMQKADGEADQTARLSDYKQAEQLLVDNAAVIPLFQIKYFYAVRPFVIGFGITAELAPSSDIWQRVYIAQH